MLKTPRIRDERYRRHVAGEDRPCESCGAMGTQAAHLRRGSNSGMGLKPGDGEIVALCPTCHDYLDGRQGTLKDAARVMSAILRNFARGRYQRWTTNQP